MEIVQIVKSRIAGYGVGIYPEGDEVNFNLVQENRDAPTKPWTMIPEGFMDLDGPMLDRVVAEGQMPVESDFVK